MVDGEVVFLVQQRDGLAHVQDADDAVDLAFVHGQLVVVAGRQLGLDVLDGQREVQRLDLAARRHDVLDRDFFQLEQVQQDALVLLRDVAARFQHNGTQFFRRQALLRVRMAHAHGADAQQAQQARHEQVDEPDRRLGDFHERPQHEAGTERDAFRVAGADDFRRYLREHDQEEGDDGRRDRDHAFLVAEEQDRDGRDERRRHRVDGRVGDQDEGQQLVRAVQQPQRGDGAAVAAPGEVAQAVLVGRHQGGFRHREEGRAENQEGECEDEHPDWYGFQGSP